LDLSAQLGAEGPATSPGLAAHFVRIAAGEGVKAAARDSTAASCSARTTRHFSNFANALYTLHGNGFAS
jgi:hypothetical protein